MHRHFSWMAVILLLASATMASAQPWIGFDDADGLPSDDVNDLLVDGDGVVWAATDDGLARFPIESSIDIDLGTVDWITSGSSRGARITAIALRGGGGVWAVGTRDGGPTLEAFDASGIRVDLPGDLQSVFDAVVAEQGEDDLLSLATDSATGELWLGGARSLYGFGRAGDVWSSTKDVLLPDGSGNPQPVSDLAVDAMGTVWAVSARGLWRRDAQGLEFVGLLIDEGLVTLEVVRLGDTEWLLIGRGNNDSVWAYAPSTSTLAVVPRPSDSNDSKPIRDFAVDVRGRLWTIGERVIWYDTVDRPDPTSWVPEVVDLGTGVPGADLSSVTTRATDDTVWIAGDGGVAALVPSRWEIFACEDIWGQDCINGQFTFIELDDAGRTALVGSRLGLARYDRVDWSTVRRFEGVDAGALDRDRRFWVGSTNSPGYFQAFDPVSLAAVSERYQSASFDRPRWRVYDVALDDGGLLWLGTDWDVRAIAPPDTTTVGETYRPDFIAEPTEPHVAVEAAGPYVFVASADRVARFERDTGTWTTLSMVDDLGFPFDVEVSAMVVSGHRVVVATLANGLVSIDQESFDPATRVVRNAMTAPQVANEITRLTADARGVWIGATAGRVYRATRDLSRIGAFDLVDELTDFVDLGSNTNVNGVAAYDDELWVAIDRTYVAHTTLSPAVARITRSPSPVVIDPLALIEVDVEVSDPDGDPADATVVWRVVGEGLDQTRTGTVEFIPYALGLGDGHFRIEVRAEDASLIGQESPAITEFELDLEPPVSVVTEPRSQDAVSGRVDIFGSAFDPDRRFRRYVLDVQRTDIDTNDWSVISIADEEVNANRLGTWDTAGLEDGRYRLRLTVLDSLDARGQILTDVVIDNEFPFVAESSPVRVNGGTGGTVYDPTGTARVIVAPFSFEDFRTISLESETDAGPDAFAIGPEGLRFRNPATLRVRVSDPERSVLFRRVDSEWVRLGGTIERHGGSMYAVARIEESGTYALRVDDGSGSGGGLRELDVQPRHFSPRTGTLGDEMAISFELGDAGTARVVVYDRAGRPRREIVEGRRLDSGSQVITWDGRDANGELVEVGLYIVAVEVDGDRLSKVITVGYD